MSKQISPIKILDPLGLFTSPPKPKTPDTPQPPAPDDAAVEEARRKEVVAAGNAQGRAGTYLTGGAGDTSTPKIGTKRLLGD